MSLYALRVVKPVAITPAMVIATNVPETDYPAWNSGTSYTVIGERVIKGHKVWQNAVNPNLNNDPESTAGKWSEVGYTNAYKAFDKSISTQTAQTTSITYQLRLGQAIGSVNGLNLTGATSMRVYVVDPVYGTVYDQTKSLLSYPALSGWWAWFFGERRAPTQALFLDLPSFPNADIYIVLTGGASLAVGVLLLGQMYRYTMGVQMGAKLGIQDYSRKERNEYGDLYMVERAFAKKANFTMLLEAPEVDAFNLFLSSVRATSCLWIGSDRYESTTVYGPYKSFDIVIPYFNYSECDLELEGLT